METFHVIIMLLIAGDFDSVNELLAESVKAHGGELPSQTVVDGLTTMIAEAYPSTAGLLSAAPGELDTDAIPYGCIKDGQFIITTGNHPDAVALTKRHQLARALATAHDAEDLDAAAHAINLHLPHGYDMKETVDNVNNNFPMTGSHLVIVEGEVVAIKDSQVH